MYFTSKDITEKTIEEIHCAVAEFSPPNGQEDTYDNLMTDQEKRQIVEQLREGHPVSEQEFRTTIVWFLRQYKCRFSNACIPLLLLQSEEVVTLVNQHLRGISTERLERANLPFVRAAFIKLCNIQGVGPTTTSKILSVIQPETFVMWDESIAAAYGFAHNAEGYCRFLMIMRDFIQRLRYFEPNLEFRLTVRERGWQVPVAKYLDEWNWIITRN